MNIQWLGHSCFLLTAEDGTRVLTDPFNAQVGYPLPHVHADIVTISHQHGDHNYITAVQGEFQVFDRPGDFTRCGVQMRGIPTFHDSEQGAKRGSNLLFRIRMDQLSILHCGDLGHPLSAEQVQAAGQVDVLLVPVGGTYTIDSQAALSVVRALEPTVTIPMHFKTSRLAFPIDTVDGFLAAAGGGRRLKLSGLDLSPATLQRSAGIVVLAPPRA